MPLIQFLSTISAVLGCMAALFFAWGTWRSSNKDLYEITSMKWDVNQHWSDSIAEQRADYKVGVIFLLASFGLQVVANLIPSDGPQLLVQPLYCALAEIFAGTACLVLWAVLYRNGNAKRTKGSQNRRKPSYSASFSSCLTKLTSTFVEKLPRALRSSRVKTLPITCSYFPPLRMRS